MSRKPLDCLGLVLEQISRTEPIRRQWAPAHHLLQESFQIAFWSCSVLSLRFRRTRSELSRTNLSPFDFPFSFQLLTSPTVVCKGFTKGKGVMFSINLKHDHKDAADNRLCNCEQLCPPPSPSQTTPPGSTDVNR